jgi:signal transduction histidine kinase
LASSLIRYAKEAQLEGLHALLVLAVASLALVAVSHLTGVVDLIFVLWPTFLILALFYYQFYGFEQHLYHLGRIILGILFFAGISAHNFLKYTQSREHAQRQILSEKLAVDDDPIAEVIYSDLEKRLVKNQGIKEVFKENGLHTREILQDYVLSRFFTGYWSKYNIEMYAFNADSTVWGKMSSVRPRSFREITQQVNAYGQASIQNPGLFYMYNSDDLVTYIAIIPLNYGLTETPDGFLVFELSSKLFPQQLGFPSMLIDESSNSPTLYTDYASARYVNKSLINSRGDYPYQAHPGSFDKIENDSEYMKKRGYEHLVSTVDKNTILVLSKPIKSPLNKVTTLSYLCAIFGIAYALAMLIRHIITRKGPLSLNLNQKIQGLLVALTFTSLVFFAFATQYYIQKNYTEKNQRQISEKMQSVLLEMEQKMGEEESLGYDMSDLLNRMLAQFSTIFFTDINVYNPDGYLLASSQMRMFNEGLISRKIDPEAFAHLNYLDQVEYIHEEKVGKMSYLSGYTPFYNSRNELLAYINLPYFAKQTELENEISSFLVAMINVFVLLFLLSILIGLYTSQWITAPLRTIRESLAGIELGKTNRLIGYSGSDEIGRLVQEYNRKVAELELNAEILAQSERESAWREMAKQVAHEIKNPLTPMKLSVQHFERSFLKGEKIDEEKVSRLTSNLVDQIDALTGIANAFSNFAQMPKAQTTVIDLVSLLKSAAELFDGFENIDLNLDLSLDKAEVLADKEQMLRVFNNIIKNAVQAIEPNKRGLIEILLEKDKEGYLATVTDNGRGISEEDYARIFVPNFTTKTRGMGLGLALTKNIVEQSGGKIWFESGENGTKFFVWLPII